MIKARLFSLVRLEVAVAWSLLDAKRKRWLLVRALLQLITGILDLLGIVFLGALSAIAINGIGSRESGDRLSQFLTLFSLQDQDFESQVTLLALTAVSIIVLRIFLSMYLSVSILKYLSRTAAEISSDLFRSTLDLGLIFVERRTILNSQFAINRGVDLLIVGSLGITMNLLADFAAVILIVCGLMLIDFVFAVSTFACFGLLGFFIYRIMKTRTQRVAESKTKFEIGSNEIIKDAFLSFRELFVKNQKARIFFKFQDIRGKSAEAIAETMFFPSIPKFIFECALIFGAVFLAVFQFMFNDAFRAISTLTVFLAAGTRLVPAILRLQQGALNLKSNFGQVGPTVDLLKEIQGSGIRNEFGIHQSFEGKLNSQGSVSGGASILLKNVNFKRKDGSGFELKNISLEICEGEFVAIVGRSGSGKSTLVDIMLGMLRVDSGLITLNGLAPEEAICNFSNLISYVTQEIHIFSGSVRDNICGLASDNIKDLEVWNVLRDVGLEAVIAEMPNGLDTQLGEFGSGLSGGQKQRIGLARALLSKPQLLVLDEATSALDSETEKEVIEVLNKLRGQMTIVAIAHRLSTFQAADRLIYLSEGSITAIGDFDSILRCEPNFQRQVEILKGIS